MRQPDRARARGCRPSRSALVAGGRASTLVPDSTVKPTDLDAGQAQAAPTSVDVSPDVIWILAVGSDARPGEDMTHTRGDALQLIGHEHQDRRRHGDRHPPRLLRVDIPGVGSDKINAALYYGGPQLLGETVGNLIGIQPDYVFVTRFEFFEDMINDIGGIDVDNPIAFSDTYLKPKRVRGGHASTSGRYDALAFSRIRHDLLRGDFDRSANQQRVLRGIQAKIRERAGEPGFIEERRAVGASQNMAHQRLAGRALPAAPGPSAAGQARRRSPPAWCRAGSATSAAPAWCCRTSTRPSGSATRPATTPRSSPATDRRPARYEQGSDRGTGSRSCAAAGCRLR